MMYFPLSGEAEKQLPCFLLTIGRLKQQEPITRQDDFSYHQLLFVTHGSGVLEYQDKIIPLPQGSAWFIHANTAHHYHAVSHPFTTRWLSFGGTCAEDLLRYFSVPPVACFTPGRFSLLRNQHQSLMEAAADERPPYELSVLLYQLLTDSFAEYNAATVHSLEPLRTWICEHYTQNLTLDDMAAHANMSKYALCRAYRRDYGITPFSFLMNVRLQKAKELLVGRKDLTIRDISTLVGFHDHAYFGRLFRQREGMTPLNFRKLFG